MNYYKERLKEINARPMKKLLEANARKKRKVFRLCSFLWDYQVPCLLNIMIGNDFAVMGWSGLALLRLGLLSSRIMEGGSR